MKIRTKILAGTLAVLVGLIVLIGLLINVFGDRAVKIGVEQGARRALQVGVRLDSASLSLLGGTMQMHNLVVDNPEGYQHPTLLTLSDADIAVRIGSLLGDTVEIKKLHLDNVNLTLEQKGLTSNLQDVLDNLRKAEEPTDEPSRNVHVKELQIKGITVNAKLLPIAGQADTVTFRLSPITLKDIGTDEDVDVAQLTGVILVAIAGGVIEQGRDVLPTDMLNKLSQDLLEAGQTILEGTLDIGTDVLDDVGDTIRGIFQRNNNN